MTYPKVSVLIPAYNHEQYVEATLLSITEQDYPNTEIVIVDDCSTDTTVDVIEQFIRTHRQANVVFTQNKVNRGVAATLNTAFRLASGEYIVFIASDDLFLPERLSFQVEFMEANPEIRVLYGNGWRERPDAPHKPLHGDLVRELLSRAPQTILRYLYTNKNPIFIQSALIRREIIVKVDGFDEDILADDWQLNLKFFKVLENRKQFAYIDEPVVIYRLHNNNLHKNFARQSKLKLEFIQHFTPRNLQREAFTNINAELARSALRRNLRGLACYHALKALSIGHRRSELVLLWKIFTRIPRGRMTDA